MTEIDLAALRAAAEKATPGPWQRVPCRSDLGVDDWDVRSISGAPERLPSGVACVDGRDELGPTGSTAAYIAAVSPDVLTALLDRLERAEDAVERVRAVARRGDVRRVSDPEEACLYLGDVTEALDGDA